MVSTNFLSHANILVANQRLKAYASYYDSLTIQGLYYVSFVPSRNVISLCQPDHRTDRLATAYLLMRKHGGREINTVRAQAHDLKLFQDFLFLWKLTPVEVDLFVLLQGFSEYLRLSEPRRPAHAIEWATMTRVALKEDAKKLLSVDHVDALSGSTCLSGGYSPRAIAKTVWTAVDFLKFLRKRTPEYKRLKIESLPSRQKVMRSMISGTTGPGTRTTIDLKAIIRDVGIHTDAGRIRPVPINAIFSPEDSNQYMSKISNDLDLLLFTVLRWFGLRPGEVSGLRIDPQSMPKHLSLLEYFEGKRWIKERVKGDVEFFSIHGSGRWVCHVIDREDPDYRRGHKGRGRRRDVPWILSQEDFGELFYRALCDRERLLDGKTDHGYLFLRRDHKSPGVRITGKTIDKKFQVYTRKLREEKAIDLTRFRPYTFRHLYATYLLKELRVPLDDVSRWLGHSTTEITRNVYCHYLSTEASHRDEGTARHISDIFRKSMESSQ